MTVNTFEPAPTNCFEYPRSQTILIGFSGVRSIQGLCFLSKQHMFSSVSNLTATCRAGFGGVINGQSELSLSPHEIKPVEHDTDVNRPNSNCSPMAQHQRISVGQWNSVLQSPTSAVLSCINPCCHSAYLTLALTPVISYLCPCSPQSSLLVTARRFEKKPGPHIGT